MLIDGRPLYFTGEEAVPMAGQPPALRMTAARS